MKKIFTLIFLIITLLLNTMNVYSEETVINEQASTEETSSAPEENETETTQETNNETITDEKKTPKEEYLEYIDKLSENTAEDKIFQSIIINGMSRKISDGIYDSSFNSELDAEQRNEIKAFLTELYDVVEKNITTPLTWKEAEEKINSSQKGYIDYSLQVYISSPNFFVVNFTLKDNYIVSTYLSGYVENPQVLVDYVAKKGNKLFLFLLGYKDTEISYNPLIHVKNIDFTNQTAEGLPYTVVERLTFDIVIPEDYFDTHIAEIADFGTTINCTVEQINTADTDPSYAVDTGEELYLIKLEGNKDTQYFYDLITAMEFNSAESGNILKFETAYTYDGTNLWYDYNKDSNSHQALEFRATPTESGISDLYLTYDLPIYESAAFAMHGTYSFPDLKATNINYEFLVENPTQMQQRRNLGVLFGVQKNDMSTKEDETDKTTEEQLPKDIYKTNMVTTATDGSVLDYYFTFVGQVDYNVPAAKSLEWYAKLGDNVKVTVIGLTTTLNGNDRHNKIMLCFKGNKGEQWFDISYAEGRLGLLNEDYSSDEEIIIDIGLHSLISFDGKVKTRNSTVYDSINVYMKFANDGTLALEYITLDTGAPQVTYDVDEINYILGGKDAYAKFW